MVVLVQMVLMGTVQVTNSIGIPPLFYFQNINMVLVMVINLSMSPLTLLLEHETKPIIWQDQSIEKDGVSNIDIHENWTADY